MKMPTKKESYEFAISQIDDECGGVLKNWVKDYVEELENIISKSILKDETMKMQIEKIGYCHYHVLDDKGGWIGNIDYNPSTKKWVLNDVMVDELTAEEMKDIVEFMEGLEE